MIEGLIATSDKVVVYKVFFIRREGEVEIKEYKSCGYIFSLGSFKRCAFSFFP